MGERPRTNTTIRCQRKPTKRMGKTLLKPVRTANAGDVFSTWLTAKLQLILGTNNETFCFRSGWPVNLKAVGIVSAVLLLSYNILAGQMVSEAGVHKHTFSVTTPRPSQFSVITKVVPQHCGLKLSTRLQNLILEVSY